MCRRIPQSRKPRTSYGTIHGRYYFWPCIRPRNLRLHIYYDLALAFWIDVIVIGLAWPFLLCMLETYALVILKRRAQKLRKETGDDSIVS